MSEDFSKAAKSIIDFRARPLAGLLFKDYLITVLESTYTKGEVAALKRALELAKKEK